MYDSQSPSKVEAKITRVSLSKITNRRSWTVAMRSVFFCRSPVNPSAKSLRILSAPPGFNLQISVNSFDCPALVPGRDWIVCVVAILVSFMVLVVGITHQPQFVAGHRRPDRQAISNLAGRA